MQCSKARLSSGVALLVRKVLSRFVDQIHTEYDNVIILKLSKELWEPRVKWCYKHHILLQPTRCITKKQKLLMVYHSLNNVLWML